jgi:hypothetical protein
MVGCVTKHADSFAPRVGVIERLARVGRRITGFWFRGLDAFPYRWGRFWDRTRFRWYSLVHGVGGAAHRTADVALRRSRWLKAIGTVLATAVVGAALVAAVVTTIGSTTDRPAPPVAAEPDVPSPAFSAAPSPSVPEDLLPGVRVHVNDQAGYLFSYPDGWQLTRSGTSTTLVDPGRKVVMEFGTAPSAPLQETSDRVRDGLTRGYRDVRVVRTSSQQTEQGQPSLVIAGTAVDDAGSTIPFLVVTIQGGTRNWAITVRYEADTDPAQSLTSIEEIVGSFRTSEPS